MPTEKNLLFIVILSFFWPMQLAAQDKVLFGLMPAANFNISLGEQYALNFKIESRHRISRMINEKPRPLFFELRDMSLLLARKVGIGNVVSAGYLFRTRPDSYGHRLIQQYTLVRNYKNIRLAHRIASDQTVEGSQDVEVRLRYRITAEIPLSGARVNRGECYLKINNEYLNTEINADQDLEIRLVPLLGFMFSDNNKLEAGLDYRANGIINYQPLHRLWVTAGWFVRI